MQSRVDRSPGLYVLSRTMCADKVCFNLTPEEYRACQQPLRLCGVTCRQGCDPAPGDYGLPCSSSGLRSPHVCQQEGACAHDMLLSTVLVIHIPSFAGDNFLRGAAIFVCMPARWIMQAHSYACSYPSRSFHVPAIPSEKRVLKSTCCGGANPHAALTAGTLSCCSWPVWTGVAQCSLHSAEAAQLPATGPQLVCSMPRPAC